MLKQTVSLPVKASMLPPMESTSRAMSSAVRWVVPLNTMCSTKCEMPLTSGSSLREPAFSQIPIDTERMWSMRSVIIVSPLGRTSRWIVRSVATANASAAMSTYFLYE